MVTPKNWAPRRGDALWLDFNPQSGSEQAGRRPAVALSPASYNQKVGLVLVCPITSRAKGYPFEVPVPNDLPVGGVILADQIKSLDWRARRARLIAPLPAATVEEVLLKTGTLLAK